MFKRMLRYIGAMMVVMAAALVPGYISLLQVEPVPLMEPSIPPPPEAEVIQGTVRRNATLVATLVDYNVPVTLANNLAGVIRPVFDPRDLRSGNPFRLERGLDGTFRGFEYKIDDERILKVERSADTFEARVERLEFDVQEREVTAEIHTSLYDALADYPKFQFLAIDLAENIFAWDVDFTTGIHKGDRIRVIVEELYHSGEFVKYGRILAAELVNAGKTYRAFRFNDDYYDENGNGLKRGFLASPLKFSRISSRFTRRRMHPILNRVRAHLAVDYAAPTGTPVFAVASGTVRSAGTNGGLGRYVEIRHANGMGTGYAHLSRIASGIRAGRAVKQGELIGYVGQTGLATGPHLHFIMTRNGVPVNPETAVRTQPPVPIKPELKPAFFAHIAPVQARMEQLRLAQELASNTRNTD